MAKNQQTQKQVAAGVAGLFDPILRKLAQRLAQSVPPDSPLRSESIESVIGAVKGFAEVYTERFPTLSAVAVEKLTDLADLFYGALGPPLLADLDKWVNELVQEAGSRLKNAADPAAELEQIKLEIRLRKELVAMVKQEILVAQPEVQEVQPDTSRLTQTNKVLTEWRDGLKSWSKKGPREKEK